MNEVGNFLDSTFVQLAWLPWGISAIVAVLAVFWAFAGQRRFKLLGVLQGVLVGGSLGYWSGTAIQSAISAGKLTVDVWFGVFDSLSFGVGSAVGIVLGALLFALLGNFWSRFFFFLAGGALGAGLVVLLLRLLPMTLSNPLIAVILFFLISAGFVLFLSFRYRVACTGVWGGFLFSTALVYPLLKLFALIGGPVWLPLLSCTGLGLILAIAGIAFQMDHPMVKNAIKDVAP